MTELVDTNAGDTDEKGKLNLKRNLTDSVIRDLKCLPGRTHTDYTDTMSCAFLRVFSDGSKEWHMRWRGHAVTRREAKPILIDYSVPGSSGTWGTTAPGMNSKTARMLAPAYAIELAAGRDPNISLKPSSFITLGEVLQRHIDFMEARNWRTKAMPHPAERSKLHPNSIRVKGLLADLVEQHGDKLMISLDGELGENLLSTYLHENDYERRPGAARQVLAYVSAAINIELSPPGKLRKSDLPKTFVNPADGLDQHIDWIKNRKRSSHAMTLTDQQLRELFTVLREERRARPANGPDSKGAQPLSAMLFEMMLISGARPSELKTLTMTEITKSEEDGIFTIRKDWHKTMRKKKKNEESARFIMFGGKVGDLASDADDLWKAILAERIRIGAEDSPWVFPTTGAKKSASGHLEDISGTGRKLLDMAGFKIQSAGRAKDPVAYGLRAAYINYALDCLGTDFTAVEIVAHNVGHANLKTTMGFYRKINETKSRLVIAKLAGHFSALTREAEQLEAA